MTGMNLHAQLILGRWNLANFFPPGLASNPNPPNLCLRVAGITVMSHHAQLWKLVFKPCLWPKNGPNTFPESSMSQQTLPYWRKLCTESPWFFPCTGIWKDWQPLFMSLAFSRPQSPAHSICLGWPFLYCCSMAMHGLPFWGDVSYDSYQYLLLSRGTINFWGSMRNIGES
jgi:hypothetical protein